MGIPWGCQPNRVIVSHVIVLFELLEEMHGKGGGRWSVPFRMPGLSVFDPCDHRGRNDTLLCFLSPSKAGPLEPLAMPNRRTRRRYLYHLALGPGLLRGFLSWT